MRFVCMVLGVAFGLLFSEGAYAEPQIQGVNSGTMPYRSFSGSITSNQQIDLLTIPTDQVFVVTTCMTSGNFFHIRQDSTIVLNRSIGACNPSLPNLFSNGNAHLVIESGTVLNLLEPANYGTAYYYIEGYFAKP